MSFISKTLSSMKETIKASQGVNYSNAPEVIKVYTLSTFGISERKVIEKKLFARGYIVKSEEEVRERDFGKTLIKGAIFLPLALHKTKKIKVTYIKINS